MTMRNEVLSIPHCFYMNILIQAILANMQLKKCSLASVSLYAPCCDLKWPVLSYETACFRS